jgi:hypothetical protein
MEGSVARSRPMQRIVSCFLLVFAVAAVPAAALQAQVSPNRGPTQQAPATKSLQLNMEDQHVLKEILLKETKVQPEGTQVALERGGKVPGEVKLHAFPDVIAKKIPKVKAHAYFIAGDTVVIVDPQQRTIAEVVK